MKKICVVTGTRAEYGLLRPVIQKITTDSLLELQLVVTGSHLSDKFGITYREIEADGYYIEKKISILAEEDSILGVAETMSMALVKFSKCFTELKPDLIIILGDRYEAFIIATAAYLARIPIAHIHGGETTEGAIDEAFRHSITKMAYLHFTTTENYRQRVIQLGEDLSRVFNVGSLGVENIQSLSLLDRDCLEDKLKFKLDGKFVLATFHPVTLENCSAKEQFMELLSAINQFDNLKVIFTKANADAEGTIINRLIDDYVAQHSYNSISFASMGMLNYLSAMQYCCLVIGNSSSGILEAPSFKIPTINIGDRQKGRIMAKSIINCSPQREAIVEAINTALSQEFRATLPDTINPYQGDNPSQDIVDTIKAFLYNKKIDLKKSFYDLEVGKCK